MVYKLKVQQEGAAPASACFRESLSLACSCSFARSSCACACVAASRASVSPSCAAAGSLSDCLKAATQAESARHSKNLYSGQAQLWEAKLRRGAVQYLALQRCLLLHYALLLCVQLLVAEGLLEPTAPLLKRMNLLPQLAAHTGV